MRAELNRRHFLAVSSGALAMAATPRLAFAQTAVPPAPVARVEVVKDTYFGETLSDPYRWMENYKDPDWLPFLKGQNAHTRAVLDAIPNRSKLLKRIQQLSGDTVLTGRVQNAGGKLFYQQRTAGSDNFRLFVKSAGKTRVLVDPTKLGGKTGHVSLDWWKASPDGSHVVYGLSKDGSEDSVLHVLVTASGKDLPDSIPNTESGNPQWLDDGSGFFYNQLTSPPESTERYLNSQARYHKLGTDPSSDPVVMKRGLVANIVYEKIQMPMVATFAGATHAALFLSDVRPESRIYIAPVADIIAGNPKWVQVATFEDEITDFAIDGGDIYMLANHGAPRGRILKASISAPTQSRQIVPQGPAVIEGFARAKDGFYLTVMDGGIYRLKRMTREGSVTEFALPFDGTIGAIYANPDEDGALVSYGGWLKPTGVWKIDTDGDFTDTRLTPMPKISVAAYETKRAFAIARDGTKIPYSLIYKKGLKLDGSTPAWISAYGSYGISAYTPSFAGKTLALIDAGFIVGYANVRGGGEYGREWHKAGQLMNKANTWRDLIDVCEDLCAKKYTSPSKLAIGGRSAGGITVGRALTERPDLFAAVIDGVGWSDPLRYVAEPNGYGEEPEWGAINVKSGYQALKLIDSYQAVKDGVAYPAVLLTTGVTDPRVGPFHVGKMTARLQAATSSDKPILLRVDFDAGHGIGSTRAQQDNEAADTYAFLLWQTGVAGYQPAA
ncbi:MAG: prolyl oligopeptidase family serine peptidase [Alphaproteobacteria bacterium]|nr:prolyl oligopeptidase family serine peptidase [Alphaproteobacteria bacterium]